MTAEAINSEVQPVSRKKTRQQAIGEEFQEGFSHLGTAMAEAGRLAAEQLGPRVEAAQKAAAPTLEAAQKAVEAKLAVTVAPRLAAATPKVAGAVAAATPAVLQARQAIAPRVEAAREAAGPALERAREAMESAVETLGPRVEAAREAAQKALADDVAPRVAAAREAMTPVLESALETAREEFEARRKELATTTAQARKQAAKKAARQRKQLEKKAARTATQVKRRVGVEPRPRRWPWVFAVLGVVAAVAVVLRRKGDDDLWAPTPAGDGPVPSYREDPVPSSPGGNSGRTVSSAQTAPGDATPPDSDLGMQAPQPAPGRSEAADRPSTPGTATSGSPLDDRGEAPPSPNPQDPS